VCQGVFRAGCPSLNLHQRQPRWSRCFFRPFGAWRFPDVPTHGLRRGLHSCAASRLGDEHRAKKIGADPKDRPRCGLRVASRRYAANPLLRPTTHAPSANELLQTNSPVIVRRRGPTWCWCSNRRRGSGKAGRDLPRWSAAARSGCRTGCSARRARRSWYRQW